MAKRPPKPQKPTSAQPNQPQSKNQKQRSAKPTPNRPASDKRPTLLPTLTLLLVMAIIGVLTAIIGYLFGQNSLKGTTQPVVNPILGVGGTGGSTRTNSQEPTFLKESDVIAEVKSQTSGLTQPSPTPSPSPTASGSPSPSPTASGSPSPSPNPTAQATLPLTSEASGVSLTVSSSQRQAGDLILNVSLQNKSKHAVQFIYTFLEVTDDKGRALTAVTNGLPTELKPESPQVTGTITIPSVALEGARTISLRLADYPNQQVVLEAANVPIN